MERVWRPVPPHSEERPQAASRRAGWPGTSPQPDCDPQTKVCSLYIAGRACLAGGNERAIRLILQGMVCGMWPLRRSAIWPTYAPTFSSHANARITRHMARQFIYHMAGLSKSYGSKKVLENINLSFYPDAKIGILGPNGAGKSTVLRIMAGLDTEFTGGAADIAFVALQGFDNTVLFKFLDHHL